jgi:fructoselysine-6-P-deglycase FrlB-like protein
MTTNFAQELTSQPQMWLLAARVASSTTLLPAPGARVAFVGCGTSLHVAQATAIYRERQGLGESDAFPASEMLLDRRYDLFVIISRSGTTTEVLDAARSVAPGTKILAVSAGDDTPLTKLVPNRIVLSFANEASIVQTRFATSVLALFLARFGWDVAASAARAESLLGQPVLEELDDVEQFVFLGRGVAVGLAAEAALKLREVLGVWTESYSTMEYRHGPIAAAGKRSLVWILDDAEPSIDTEIARTGARVVRGGGDPLAEIVRIHRVAQHLAAGRNIDPDNPPHLTRSIVLDRG